MFLIFNRKLYVTLCITILLLTSCFKSTQNNDNLIQNNLTTTNSLGNMSSPYNHEPWITDLMSEYLRNGSLSELPTPEAELPILSIVPSAASVENGGSIDLTIYRSGNVGNTVNGIITDVGSFTIPAGSNFIDIPNIPVSTGNETKTFEATADGHISSSVNVRVFTPLTQSEMSVGLGSPLTNNCDIPHGISIYWKTTDHLVVEAPCQQSTEKILLISEAGNINIQIEKVQIELPNPTFVGVAANINISNNVSDCDEQAIDGIVDASFECSIASVSSSLVSKLSVNTNPYNHSEKTIIYSSTLEITKADYVVFKNQFQFSDGIDVYTNFIKNHSGAGITTTGTLDTQSIGLYALEGIDMRDIDFTTVDGNITLAANVATAKLDQPVNFCDNNRVASGPGLNLVLGTTVFSTSGKIQLLGCGATNLFSGNHGVAFNDATISSSSGRIYIRGVGGTYNGSAPNPLYYDDTYISGPTRAVFKADPLSQVGHNIGVKIFNSDIKSVTNALIDIKGIGGLNSGKENYGVHLHAESGDEVLIQSEGSGHIMITGEGGREAWNLSNTGLRIQGNSVVKTTHQTHINNIFLYGIGGNGNCPRFIDPDFIESQDASPAEIDTCSFNGIDLNYNSEIISSGSGIIYLNGKGGSAPNREHHGIQMSAALEVDCDPVLATYSVEKCGSSNALIKSTNGADIILVGEGGKDGNGVPELLHIAGSGIYLLHGSEINTLSSGSIYMTGIAGKGADSGQGIWLEGEFDGYQGDIPLCNNGIPNPSGEASPCRKQNIISSINGNITMVGRGTTHNNSVQFGQQNMGIFSIYSVVESKGIGNILLLGTGGTGFMGAAIGTILAKNAYVKSNSGAIRLEGFARNTFGPGNSGVVIGDASTVESTNGPITLIGSGSGSGSFPMNNNIGVAIQQIQFPDRKTIELNPIDKSYTLVNADKGSSVRTENSDISIYGTSGKGIATNRYGVVIGNISGETSAFIHSVDVRNSDNQLKIVGTDVGDPNSTTNNIVIKHDGQVHWGNHSIYGPTIY